MLYIAYGSNMNKNQMRIRCPKAKPMGAYFLDGWRLVFRGVADMIRDENAKTPIALWDITKDCERALDRYEGVPTLYSKVKLKKGNDVYLTYLMNANTYALPFKPYYDGIADGYYHFFKDKYEKALPYLEDALSYTEQSKPDGFGGHYPKRFAGQPIKYSQ
tara:strand:- start:2875 stop:3357 length:483 start_codon:yes stop_codon:yes gene_type:complete